MLQIRIFGCQIGNFEFHGPNRKLLDFRPTCLTFPALFLFLMFSTNIKFGLCHAPFDDRLEYLLS